MILPTSPIPPSTKSPRKMVLYSAPKVGKTSLLALLQNNLILDLEGGTEFISALKIPITELSQLTEAGIAIKEAKRPYPFVTVDTITRLEMWCEGDATAMYKANPIGKTFTGDNVLSLPNGAGYYWLRQSMKRWLSSLETLAPRVIFVGHLKDKFLNRDGKEVSASDVDLTGKIKSIVCSDADAVGLLFRREGNLVLTFKSSDEVICGSRCEHLKGQDIVVGTYENGQLTAHWDRIFID